MPALEGIRVVDFTWVVAGPVATRILADHGAEVIKVEREPPPFMGPRRVGMQCDLNRGKLSLGLNMNHPRGGKLARRLVEASDIVIDNFSPRVMTAWGMDYESLSTIKPDIICIGMSGMGRTGPRANFVTYGPTLQVISGFAALMAGPNGEPIGFGYSFSDLVGGYTGALAALAALWYRRRTGRGQFIDLSQFEALVSVLGPALLDHTVNRRPIEAPGYQSQEGPAAPHGVFRCAPRGDDHDRWIAISVRSQAEWERFVAAIGSPGWASNPKFQTLFLRMRNRDELDAEVAQWTKGQAAEGVMQLLQRAGIAAGVVANGADLCERDPQLRERGFWPEVALVDGGTTRVTGVTSRLSATPGRVRSGTPDVGAHNDYVLGELLGLSVAERQTLVAEKALWTQSAPAA